MPVSGDVGPRGTTATTTASLGPLVRGGSAVTGARGNSENANNSVNLVEMFQASREKNSKQINE